MSDRLVCFLYVLMRDMVVPGEVERIMQGHIEGRNVDRASSVERAYSNRHLEAYARELAERLR